MWCKKRQLLKLSFFVYKFMNDVGIFLFYQ